MRLEFLKNTSSSQFILPITWGIATILWALLPVEHSHIISDGQYGLWSLMPTSITGESRPIYLGYVFAALVVYLLAKFTNVFVLLRISSRMLSSTLAIFLGCILCLHTLFPGHVVMLCVILSFFALFATYQLPAPVPTLLSYLFISMGSLVFPKLLLFVPVYWLCQVYLRSLSFRCFFASLFGVSLPYWFFFAVSFCYEGGTQQFVDICEEIIDFDMPDWTTVQLTDILIFAYIVVFFLFGAVDFWTHSFLDKTRTRIIYKTTIAHAFVTLLFIILLPSCFHVLLAVLIIDSALVGGHFIALTYNLFSHIYALIMLILLVLLVIAQIIL